MAAPKAATPPASPEELRKPVALDEAAQRTATQYLGALGRGRKATTARDFAKAEAEFSECLKLVPGDPRALGERGYARLLAGKWDDADADFKVAVEKAGSTALLVQLVHNRLLVARQRGDEQAARGFEEEKKRLKASRRIAPGIDCSANAQAVTLSPERPKTLTEAYRMMVKAHADATSAQPDEVALGDNGPPEGTPPPVPSEAQLWQQMTGGDARDGGWALTTSSSYGATMSGHALFSKAGQLYLFPALYSSLAFRCGQDGGGQLSVGGGGVVPWHIKFEQEQLVVGYMCGGEDGRNIAPCGSPEDSTGTPLQSYCALASSNVRVTVLDSKTFEGILELTVGAQPSGDGSMVDAPHLLDVEWLPDHLTMNACGSRREVPYTLASE
jgi:hypothetical protein